MTTRKKQQAFAVTMGLLAGGCGPLNPLAGDDDHDGFVEFDGDCDDGDALTYPGAASRDDAQACMRDADGDGWGDASADGIWVAGSDCDDGDPSMPNDDLDCDGVRTGEDCDDGDPGLLDITNDGDCDRVLTQDDCDDADRASTTRSEDRDCDGILTEDDCDDGDATSTIVAYDNDCDGVHTVDDCDDGDAGLLDIASDGDCDGVLSVDDCDDADQASTTVSADRDCDGVLTDDDCDDEDATRTSVADDNDCDGVHTVDDCDDGDAGLLDIASDGDCDGVLSVDDCDDMNPSLLDVADDHDCDGVWTSADCNDEDGALLAIAADADCDGVLTADDCDDGDATSTSIADDNDCDGVHTVDDCDDGDAGLLDITNDGDCDRVLTVDDCDDMNPSLLDVADDHDCDGASTSADCDDEDGTLLAIAADADCDGVLTADDCDDQDPMSVVVADDGDCDGYPDALDCDDSMADVFPGAVEICDGVDNDCTPASGCPGATQIGAGGGHTCALTSPGTVRCWGDNTYGQLGYGNTTWIGDTELPLSVGSVSLGGTVTQIAVGYEHTCALLSTGAVRCWGRNSSGQLGYGNVAHIGDTEFPSSVGTVSVGGTVTQIAAGASHTCALLSTGAVRCWGNNAYGQLGYGNTTQIGDTELPSSIGTVSVGGTVTRIATGDYDTCALLSTGAVRCWGRGNYGQLGYGNTGHVGDNELPSSVGTVSLGGTVTQIDAGYDHTCALLSTGAVRCWGRNTWGQLGYGNTDQIGDNELPSAVGSLSLGGTATRIAAGSSHTCAVLSTGDLRCWGYNAHGELGYGNTEQIGDTELPSTAGAVSIGGIATQIVAGSASTCVLLSTGHMRCWGLNSSGHLGYGNKIQIGDDELPSSVGPIPVAQ